MRKFSKSHAFISLKGNILQSPVKKKKAGVLDIKIIIIYYLYRRDISYPQNNLPLKNKQEMSVDKTEKNVIEAYKYKV